ncbi:MAG: hypothetical protein KTV77_03985 [Wolbachia endosymbiont of Fragariocoptes setiger]|nr:hypothetical protein [Wolbachia endosymbiont of Fragariocoptes setiger]
MTKTHNNTTIKQDNDTEEGNLIESTIFIIGGLVLSALIISSLWFTIKLLTAVAVATMFFQLGKTSYKLLSETFSKHGDENKYVKIGVTTTCFLSSVLLLNSILHTGLITTLLFCGTLIFLEHGNNKEFTKYLDESSDKVVDNVCSFLSEMKISSSKRGETAEIS